MLNVVFKKKRYTRYRFKKLQYSLCGRKNCSEYAYSGHRGRRNKNSKERRKKKLIIDTHKDEIDAVKALLKEEMESAVSLSVRLVADVNVGENWGEAK